MKSALRYGFTLIEVNIALVIIGLIVGAILVGQSLLNAAAARGQISQIEKYNQAVGMFREKYGSLPGDIPNPDATSYGFQSRGQYAGEGDGNGILEGVYSNAAGQNCGADQITGENGMLWVDLSTAHLIDGGFSSATPTVYNGGTSAVGLYLPAAKIGAGNYVYSWSTGGMNYWGISSITWLGSGIPTSQPMLTVAQAYAIDNKVDDGLPQSGRVTAQYLDGSSFGYSIGTGFGWAGSGGVTGGPYTTATPGTSTTCFDNGNTSGAVQKYSISRSNGTGVNCAVSFRLQ